MSNTESVKLAERLIETQTTYGNHISGWERFIRDHKNYLIKTGDIHTLSSEEKSRNKYKLRYLLRDIGVDPVLYWVVFIMNNIDSDIEFVNLSHLYIRYSYNTTNPLEMISWKYWSLDMLCVFLDMMLFMP